MAAPAAEAPAEAPLDYYQEARLKSLELAKSQYKKIFRMRAQEFIRGKGTLAVVTDEVCMGCTHCFDNCAFEAIDMVERKFTLPELTYTSRKAQIVLENCVGCEKCAIVCPVDAITMVTMEGFQVIDGLVKPIEGAEVPERPPFYAPPKPGAPRPPVDAVPFTPEPPKEEVKPPVPQKPVPAKESPVPAKATAPKTATPPKPEQPTPPKKTAKKEADK